MRLLQLNIWEGRLIRHIPQFIARLDPDILCLQEVFSCSDLVVKPTDQFNALEKIRSVAAYKYSFFSPTLSVRYADVDVQYGNAILSKLPLRNKQTVFTAGSYIPDYKAAADLPATHNMQTAEVHVPGRRFSIANYQAAAEPNRLGSKKSVQHMSIVAEHLKKLPSPLIFAGDLNVTAESQTMRVFDDFLIDLTASHNITTTLSRLGKVTDAACDHVLVSSDITVKDYYTTDDLISDHKALVLDFDV